jgi:hypothetical protein
MANWNDDNYYDDLDEEEELEEEEEYEEDEEEDDEIHELEVDENGYPRRHGYIPDNDEE